MEEVAEQVRKVHLKTGRDVREILESMRDEGYIECNDLAFETLVKMASDDR